MLLDELYGLPWGRLTSFFQKLVWFISLTSILRDFVDTDPMLDKEGNTNDGYDEDGGNITGHFTNNP